MNHVYRTVWNEHTRTYVAVPENTRARGKRSGAVVRAVAAGALFLLGAVGSVQATQATADGTDVIVPAGSVLTSAQATNGGTITGDQITVDGDVNNSEGGVVFAGPVGASTITLSNSFITNTTTGSSGARAVNARGAGTLISLTNTDATLIAPSTGGYANSASVVAATYGGHVDLTGGTFTSSGDYVFGLSASGNQVVAVGTLPAGNEDINASGIAVVTSGAHAIGVQAYGNGMGGGLNPAGNTTVELNDSTVTTTGAGAHGIQSKHVGAIVTGSGDTISTAGAGADGIQVDVGGVVNLANTSITTTGVGSVGALALGGGSITLAGGSVDAAQGAGVIAYGTDSTIALSDIAITTGSGQIAVGALNGGTVTGDGVTVVGSMNDSESGLVFAGPSGPSTITLSNSSIDNETSGGPGARAVNARGAGSQINLTNTDVTLSTTAPGPDDADAKSVVAATYGGHVTLTGGTFTASGTSTYGLVASGDQIAPVGTLPAGGESIIANGVNVIVNGDYTNGVWAYGNPDGLNPAGGTSIELNNSTVTMNGYSSYGIEANNAGAMVSGSGNTILTALADSDGYGVRAKNGGVVQLSGGSITTLGANTAGASALNGAVALTDVAVSTSGDSSDGAIAQGGGQIALDGGSILTTGNNADGLSINDAGSNFTMVNGTTITTQGTSARGIAFNVGGDVVLDTTGGSITTSGDSSPGVYVAPATSLVAHLGNITTTGNYSAGITSGNAVGTTSSIDTASGTLIQTSGYGSDGVNIASVGDNTVTLDGNLVTSGDGSDGIYAASNSGTTSVTAQGNITTSGEESYGINAYGTTVNVDVLGNITTSGTYGDGLDASGSLVNVNLQGNIMTSGDDAWGIYTDAWGGTANVNVAGTIAMSGNGDVGVGAYGGTDNVDVSGSVAAVGDNSVGVDAEGTAVNVNVGGHVAATGQYSVGVLALASPGSVDGGETFVPGSATVTVGTGASVQGGWQADLWGGLADPSVGTGNNGYNGNYPSAGILIGTSSLMNQDSGGGTAGLAVGGLVNGVAIGHSQINNAGMIGAGSDRAIAVFTPYYGGEGESELAMGTQGGGTLDPTNPGEVGIENQGTITGFVTLAPTGGSFITGYDESDNPIYGPYTVYGQNVFDNAATGVFNIRHFADTDGDGVRDTKRVSVSDFGGPNAVFNNEAQATVRLAPVTGETAVDSTGQYVPTTGIDSRPLEASFYDIARAGVVQGQLVNLSTFDNAGTIDLTGSAVGNVLVITGNSDVSTPVTGSASPGVFVSDGGKLITNVMLNAGISPGGQSNSYADMLVVDSTQTGAGGATTIELHNQGGLGGLTTGNGIELVEVRDKTAGASDAGAFALLGQRTAAGAFDYSLNQNGVGSDAADGNWYLRSSYRPEVPLYMAAPALANRMGLDMLGTYHDRVGEDFSEEANAQTMSTPHAGWGRIYGSNQHTELQGNSSGRLNQFQSYGPAYSMDTWGVQTGMDLKRTYNEANQTADVMGAYFGYSHGRASVENVLDDGSAGHISMDGFSLGGYWTRKGVNGWYIDTVAQGTLYSSIHAESSLGQSLSTHGYGLAASVEGGYPFELGQGYKFEPQGQLIYQYINLKGGHDDYGQVQYESNGALTGRVGARLDRTFITASGNKITPWLRANLWFSPSSNATTTFTSLSGNNPVVLNPRLGGTWAQYGLGLSGQINKHVSVFASADYDVSVSGQDWHGYAGRLGMKVAW